MERLGSGIAVVLLYGYTIYNDKREMSHAMSLFWVLRGGMSERIMNSLSTHYKV